MPIMSDTVANIIQGAIAIKNNDKISDCGSLEELKSTAVSKPNISLNPTKRATMKKINPIVEKTYPTIFPAFILYPHFKIVLRYLHQ